MIGVWLRRWQRIANRQRRIDHGIADDPKTARRTYRDDSDQEFLRRQIMARTYRRTR